MTHTSQIHVSDTMINLLLYISSILLVIRYVTWRHKISVYLSYGWFMACNVFNQLINQFIYQFILTIWQWKRLDVLQMQSILAKLNGSTLIYWNSVNYNSVNWTDQNMCLLLKICLINIHRKTTLSTQSTNWGRRQPESITRLHNQNNYI
jgi:hypothetical protein